MVKRTNHKPIYTSVQEWQEATGTTGRRLAQLLAVKNEFGPGLACKESHLSNVLKKSRRCSLPLALKLSRITNVPVENIAAWPPEYEEAV